MTAPRGDQDRLARRLDRERRTRRTAEALAERALRRACHELETTQLRAEVATAALTADSPGEAYRSVLPRLRLVTGASVAAVLVPAPHAHDTLVLGDDVDGDQPHLGRVVEATAGRRFPRGVGLPGGVLDSRRPAWLETWRGTGSDREAALSPGSAAAFPVLTDDTVTAVVELHFGSATCRDEGLLDLLAELGRQLGTVAARRSAAERADDERRRLQAAVNARTRDVEVAEAAVREAAGSRSAFLAAVSHELRTPLHTVLGSVDLLLGDAPSGPTSTAASPDATAGTAGRIGPTGPEARELLQTARTAGQDLLRLVQRLLDLAALEGGGIVVRPRPARPVDVAEAVVARHAAAADARGLDLRVVASAGADDVVRVDDDRLGEVLDALVDNAVAVTQAGSVHVEVSRDGDRVVLDVRDTGPGLDAATAAAALEPFGRADDRRPGTVGLGLPLAARTTEALGGTLRLTGDPGRGTTARVEVPVAPVPGQRGAAGRRVLLVEDNPVNRTLAAAMLEHLGLEVTQVGDGAEALRVLAEVPVDLVLMDCQMPVVDGYEATRRLRALEAGATPSDVPVVAVTAHADPGARERCLVAGMDDYLAKPFTVAQLQPLVERWLGLSR